MLRGLSLWHLMSEVATEMKYEDEAREGGWRTTDSSASKIQKH